MDLRVPDLTPMTESTCILQESIIPALQCAVPTIYFSARKAMEMSMARHGMHAQDMCVGLYSPAHHNVLYLHTTQIPGAKSKEQHQFTTNSSYATTVHIKLYLKVSS